MEQNPPRKADSHSVDK